jgi:hypothetical protein
LHDFLYWRHIDHDSTEDDGLGPRQWNDSTEIGDMWSMQVTDKRDMRIEWNENWTKGNMRTKR